MRARERNWKIITRKTVNKEFERYNSNELSLNLLNHIAIGIVRISETELYSKNVQLYKITINNKEISKMQNKYL